MTTQPRKTESAPLCPVCHQEAEYHRNGFEDCLAARVAELEAALGKLLGDMRLQEYYGFSGELAEFPDIVSEHMNTAGDLLAEVQS